MEMKMKISSHPTVRYFLMTAMPVHSSCLSNLSDFVFSMPYKNLKQQEAIYLALFEEVTMAKCLLEQVALVAQGREKLYQRILACIQDF